MSFGKILAIVAIIAGVAFIATLANNSDHKKGGSRAILWSIVACVAFSVALLLARRRPLWATC